MDQIPAFSLQGQQAAPEDGLTVPVVNGGII
jgi:hypothetical protein